MVHMCMSAGLKDALEDWVEAGRSFLQSSDWAITLRIFSPSGIKLLIYKVKESGKVALLPPMLQESPT